MPKSVFERHFTVDIEISLGNYVKMTDLCTELVQQGTFAFICPMTRSYSFCEERYFFYTGRNRKTTASVTKLLSDSFSKSGIRSPLNIEIIFYITPADLCYHECIGKPPTHLRRPYPFTRRDSVSDLEPAPASDQTGSTDSAPDSVPASAPKTHTRDPTGGERNPDKRLGTVDLGE